MEVIVRPDTDSAVKLTARLIADAINAKPEFTLGLATGGTMEAVYAELAAMNKAGKVDFSLTKTFNLDEYIGLPEDHPAGFRKYLRERFINKLPVKPASFHPVNGSDPDPEKVDLRWT